MLDLECLRLIWWVLFGVLFIGFAVTDGFDLGIAALLPFVAKNDLERRVVLNTIGPVWEGNQVWIILAAGAIFAAWPLVYAVAFSGLYFVILLLLLTMGISRPVSFKYRSKLKNPVWRFCWDAAVFIGGLVPALIFGLLVGNVLQGLPFRYDEQIRLSYEGGFWALFNPFACWCALTSLFMLIMHGGIYLALKTEALLANRALRFSKGAAILFMLFFAGGGLWAAYAIVGYEVTSVLSPEGYSNPLHKEVVKRLGAWLLNYSRYPFTLAAPVLGFLGAAAAMLSVQGKALKTAFLCSALSLFGVISTVGVSMFPFIIPSSLDPASSLLVWDASSTQLTLFLMLIAALIFVPLIVLYTAWVYYVLRDKVTAKEIKENI